ncbi:transmembrane protease serine 11B-like protein [Alligator sinensis]|uniref:Transmembrane protease serine 11B-like protein n=1 Tax=Alligator sinensis TaxID=38654 RepID=A0A1U7S8V7_ALLSI|nr:transmembrane protease serine 11B-like protein [Alligator sinensis]
MNPQIYLKCSGSVNIFDVEQKAANQQRLRKLGLKGFLALTFTGIQRLTHSDTQMKRLEPWKIALIVLSILAFLALVIGLLVFFLSNEEKRYYTANFKITNRQYHPDFEKQTSEEFRRLSTEIERLITRTFEASILKDRYITSQVVSLSPDPTGVVAQVVLMFEFVSADSQAGNQERVNKVLHMQMKTYTGSLEIDPSSFKLTRVKRESGENLLNNCCGTRMQMVSSVGVARITGGRLAQAGEWPWQASIQLNGMHRCGASIISNTWLVTAAHCFRGVKDPRVWTASFGTVRRPPKERRAIQSIIVHEQYADYLYNHEYDIAVMKLATPLPFTSEIHSVCLPEPLQVFPENTSCFVTGWGALRDDGQSVNQLRQAEVKIIGTNICNREEVYNGAITPGMVCAGYLEGKIDACQGDSGGPLVTPDSRGIWYLVGIVSWGDECAKPNKPGVYTRVTYYRDWITSKTGL